MASAGFSRAMDNFFVACNNVDRRVLSVYTSSARLHKVATCFTKFAVSLDSNVVDMSLSKRLAVSFKRPWRIQDLKAGSSQNITPQIIRVPELGLLGYAR